MRIASLQLLYGHDTNMLFGMILDFANAAETNVKANTDWSVNVLSLERFRKFTEFVIKVESIELIVGSNSSYFYLSSPNVWIIEVVVLHIEIYLTLWVDAKLCRAI